VTFGLTSSEGDSPAPTRPRESGQIVHAELPGEGPVDTDRPPSEHKARLMNLLLNLIGCIRNVNCFRKTVEWARHPGATVDRRHYQAR